MPRAAARAPYCGLPGLAGEAGPRARRWRLARRTSPGWTEPTLLAAAGRAATTPAMPEQLADGLSAGLTAAPAAARAGAASTLNTVVQGAWAVLLGRLTGRDDVVFGVTVAGRPAELAGVERDGRPVHQHPAGAGAAAPGEPLAALLAGLQDSQARLLTCQHVGLAEIQRAAGSGELFDTLVVFENYPVDRAALAGRRRICEWPASRCRTRPTIPLSPGGGARGTAAAAAGLRPGAVRAGTASRWWRGSCGCWSRQWRRPMRRCTGWRSSAPRSVANCWRSSMRRPGRWPEATLPQLFEAQWRAPRTPWR